MKSNQDIWSDTQGINWAIYQFQPAISSYQMSFPVSFYSLPVDQLSIFETKVNIWGRKFLL